MNGRGRPGETRRRGGLNQATNFDKAAARGNMRMCDRLSEGHDRCEVHVGPFEHLVPFVTRSRQEHRGNGSAQFRPPRAIMLGVMEGPGQIQAFAQLAEEFRFDRSDRYIAAVRRLIDAIIGRAAIEQIGTPDA